MINMIHAPALKLATACRNLVQYCLKRRGVTRPDVPCQNSKGKPKLSYCALTFAGGIPCCEYFDKTICGKRGCNEAESHTDAMYVVATKERSVSSRALDGLRPRRPRRFADMPTPWCRHVDNDVSSMLMRTCSR